VVDTSENKLFKRPSNDRLVSKERFHKALACRTRLKMMEMLERRAMYGHELVRRLEIGQSTVSYHLGILRKAGLILALQRAGGRLYLLAKEKAAA
jgi:DNA-binding transcriptional ArsR family regulator